jgi:hypothetical protein
MSKYTQLDWGTRVSRHTFEGIDILYQNLPGTTPVQISLDSSAVKQLIRFLQAEGIIPEQPACSPCIQEFSVVQVAFEDEATGLPQVADAIFFRGQLYNATRLPKEAVSALVRYGIAERKAKEWATLLQQTVGKG